MFKNRIIINLRDNIRIFNIRRRYKIPLTNIFKRISLETHTDCNYRCGFCAQSYTKRPAGRLSEDAFEKIAHGLSVINYAGSVGFQLNNEPLMDTRIIKFISLVRKRCPRARIDVITNGSLLTKALTRELFQAGLNLLCINDYSSLPGLRKKFIEIKQNFKNWPIRISPRRGFDKNRTNRAGNARQSQCGTYLKKFCHRPFSQMCIGANGEAVLCCCDFKYEVTVGNITRDALDDIWFGKRLAYIRSKLYNGDRNGLLCERCNFKGYL